MAAARLQLSLVFSSPGPATAPAYPAVPGGRESLAPVAEQLVPRLLAAAGPLWEALLAPGGSLAALEPLGAVVLAEVVDAISDIMPGGALCVPLLSV